MAERRCYPGTRLVAGVAGRRGRDMRTWLAGRGLAIVATGAATWDDRAMIETGGSPRAGFVARVASGRRHNMRVRLALNQTTKKTKNTQTKHNTHMVEARARE